MLVYKIIFTIKGVEFSPNNFLDNAKLGDEVDVFDSNEPDDLINETEKYGFGLLSIELKKLCLKNDLDMYEKEYLKIFKSNIELLGKVEQIIYNLDIYYSDFCSYELSVSENYSQYIKFDFNMPVNTYKVSEDEITEMLLDNGYQLIQIENYDW